MILLAVPLYAFCVCTISMADENNLSNHKGHLKPFGTGKSIPVVDYNGFPSPQHFYSEYVLKRVPVVMRGAAKQFPSFRLWDDNYFLNLNLDNKQTSFVHVETKKKEDREQATDYLHFHQFLKIYNHTEHYMVQPIPQFLKGDVLVPGPLQCTSFIQKIVDTIMWFSSGGTKSVVHTDAVDNINCLIRGQKTFVIVDPAKYGEFVPLDRANGSYSTLDVDRVDFNKFPSMAKVEEYYLTQMDAGDCLYIPFKWIHQVRSYNRNIAINFWWDSEEFKPSSDLWEKECTPKFDPSWTCASIQTIGIETLEFVGQLKSLIYANNGTLDPDAFILSINQGADLLEREIGNGFKLQLNSVFLIADKDKDLLLTPEDIPLWTVDDMKRMDLYFRRYERIIQAFEEHVRRHEEAENGNEESQESQESKDELPPEYRGLHEEL